MDLLIGIVIGIVLVVYFGIGIILWILSAGLGDPNPLIIVSWPFKMIYMAFSVKQNPDSYHKTAGTYKPLDPNYVASGEQRITIQYKVGLVGDRRERRENLIRRIRKIRGILDVFKCRIDWSTISISAQTVEAVLPTNMLNELKESLADGPYHFDEVEVVYVEKE